MAILKAKKIREMSDKEVEERLKELQLETVRIRPHAKSALSSLVTRGLYFFRHRVPIVAFRERTVMTDARPTVARSAYGHIAYLSIRRQVAEQNEIADRALKRLLVKLCSEYAHVELCRRGRVGNHDVKMLEPKILQWKWWRR